MSFRGQAILLTGASIGIGREIALRLAGEGARLALAARDVAKLEEVAALCRERGGEAIVVRADVGVEADCLALVDRTVESFGRLDAIFLNAGQDMWSRLDELADPSIFEQLIRVNYLGPAWLTWRALPHLKASRGRIVVMSSLAGLTGVPTRTGYAATKHALQGFFDSLRVELRRTGVSVTIVCPDFVLSEIHRRALGPDGKPLGTSPMQEGKLMTAERCAELAVDAAAKRKRQVLLSFRGKLGQYFRPFVPGIIDSIAEKSVARGH
jgi:NAD(P)-dependent dehydrogenase (short-subunit alcohol dehydrogenase family)